MTEVNNGEAAAGEATAAPQQTEECSGATAMQLALQSQQCANRPMQRQHIAIEAVMRFLFECLLNWECLRFLIKDKVHAI
jgi:hypothetical protein